jgi:perosamine synthetase
MTFAASANCVVYQGGTPVFADVDADTLLLDPTKVEGLIAHRTKAIIAVDYAGQPCDYDALCDIARRHKLALVADACHALGGSYKGRPVGSLADPNTFSFHPVKHVTTGEGGMVTTDDTELARRMRIFRNHGIATNHRQREEKGSWFYEMTELGYNYRMTDFQCALGMSQLAKLPAWIARRRQIAAAYDSAFADLPEVKPLRTRPEAGHAYHLYVVQLQLERLKVDRARTFAALRAENIGVNVHYAPAHLHPFYRRRFGAKPGDCPIAQQAYDRLLTLPLFPAMTDADVSDVFAAMQKVCRASRQ